MSRASLNASHVIQGKKYLRNVSLSSGATIDSARLEHLERGTQQERASQPRRTIVS